MQSNSEYPKLVALDTDGTLFWGTLDQNLWGKGPGAYSPIEDNIIKVNEWVIQDHSNRYYQCGMHSDVPRVVSDIRMQGAKIAIVSRNTSKSMCDRALSYMNVPNENGLARPIIELIEFDEIYDADKTAHFEAIKGWTSIDYSDMLLFDDESVSDTVEMMLGVTFQLCPDNNGLTWDIYQAGLNKWRRNKSIISPFLGNSLDLYPNKKLLGYSGMDIRTIEALEKGGRRTDRKEAARWGYAMYIADDPAIAKYFANWIKSAFGGAEAETIVCQIWARDGAIFDSLPKIWIPETEPWTDNINWEASAISWSQEMRDRRIASWGVQKPYILFSKHVNMGQGFPVPNMARWNEMVIYGQVQEALLTTVRMNDHQLEASIQAETHPRYEQMIKEWNITVPLETWYDFMAHGEI